MFDRARIRLHDDRASCSRPSGLASRRRPRCSRPNSVRLAMRADDHAASSRAVSFLNCPRCGLSIRQSGRWLTIEHCPRCIARARLAVNLFSSPLPAVERTGKARPTRPSIAAARKPSWAAQLDARSGSRSETGDERPVSPVRLHSSRDGSADPLRVAVVAPPWIAVPPPDYGGSRPWSTWFVERWLNVVMRSRCSRRRARAQGRTCVVCLTPRIGMRSVRCTSHTTSLARGSSST